MQDFYRELFNKDPLQVSTHDMMMGFAKFEKSIRTCLPLPTDRTLGSRNRWGLDRR